MKRLKKVLTSLLAIAMVSSIAVMPASANTFIYEKEANALNKLGLYKGISEARFDPDLSATLDRQTGVVMLLRLFGQEEEAKKLTNEKANSILSKFRDSGSIAGWSKKQVAYAVDKGFVKGYSENSTFRPSIALNGKAYCSLILQQLGYDGDFQYDKAASKLSEIGGLTSMQGNMFSSDAKLIKDSLVGISYGALQAKYKSNGEELVKKLVEKGVVSAQKVKEAGLDYAKIVAVEAISDVTVIIGVSPKLPTSVKAEYDDGTKENVSVSWPYVDTSKAGEQIISGTINGSSVTAKVKITVIPDKLKAEAVSSENLKEVIVKFSKPLENEDEAKDKSNYGVDGNSVINAELSDDKMAVTLLLKNALKQQSDVEVSVDKEVGLDEDVELYIDKVMDVSIPEVVEVVAVGNGLIKVTFNEPVQNATSNTSYAINNKTIGSSKLSLSNNEKTVSFKLIKRLSSGSHKFTVKDKINDYAGYLVEDNETSFTVEDDKKAPTAKIKSATQTKAVISFSEEIEKPELNEVETNAGAKIENIELDDDNMTLTVYFDVENALPASGCNIIIEGVSDFSGNSKDIKLAVTPDHDVTKPEYVGYTIENQNEIVLEFSKEVFSKYGEFKLTDDNDNTIDLSSATYYKNNEDEYVKSKLVIKRADDQKFESGKYELVISEVTDLNPLKNEMIKKTVNITVADNSAANVSSVYVNNDDNQVFIKFNEEVEEISATEYSNYYYTVNNIAKRLEKNAMDIDLLSDNETVCITFSVDKDDYKDREAILVSKISRIQVEAVKDIKGNEMKAQSVSSKDFKSDSSTAPEITSAVVTDKNTIVVKIKGSINPDTLEPDDFYITAGKDDRGQDIVIMAWDALYDSDESEITLNVNTDIDSNGTYNGKSIYLGLEDRDNIDTENTFKQKLTIASSIKVSEDFKPLAKSIASAHYEKSVGTVAFIELSEDLRLNHGDQLSQNDLAQFRVKADGKTIDAEIYYYNADREDNRATDEDESSARFKVVIEENYRIGKVQVIFYRASKATIVDYSGNALDDFDFTQSVE